MYIFRYALAHPLTNYNEVPTKGFLPPKDYVRPTENSTLHKLPRIVKPEKEGKSKRGDGGECVCVLYIWIVISFYGHIYTPFIIEPHYPDKEHGETILKTKSFANVYNSSISHKANSPHKQSGCKYIWVYMFTLVYSTYISLCVSIYLYSK